MEILKYIVLSLVIISELIILFFAGKSGRFIKVLFLNAIIGIIAVVVVNVTSKYTNCYIPINLFTVVFPSTFGIPAVIGIVLLKFIFL